MHIQDLFSLTGNSALVIGGAGKVGFSLAEGLAEAGALVWIGSRDQTTVSRAVDRLTEAGYSARGITVDQADEKSVQYALERISAFGSPPCVLVNSGVVRPMKGFFHDSFEAWDESMRVNARGLFLTCRTFGLAMAENGGGSIINVSSIYGLVAPRMSIYEGSDFETEPDYPYTKGGMIAFSKYLAAYFADRGVRVNVLAPGGVFNHQPREFLERYTAHVPLQRMATSDDLKGAAVFLASKASQYVTGTVLPVDGGWTAV